MRGGSGQQCRGQNTDDGQKGTDNKYKFVCVNYMRESASEFQVASGTALARICTHAPAYIKFLAPAFT